MTVTVCINGFVLYVSASAMYEDLGCTVHAHCNFQNQWFGFRLGQNNREGVLECVGEIVGILMVGGGGEGGSLEVMHVNLQLHVSS